MDCGFWKKHSTLNEKEFRIQLYVTTQEDTFIFGTTFEYFPKDSTERDGAKGEKSMRHCLTSSFPFFFIIDIRKLNAIHVTKKKTMARFLAANTDDFETIHFFRFKQDNGKKGEKRCHIFRHLLFRYSSSSLSSMPFMLRKKKLCRDFKVPFFFLAANNVDFEITSFFASNGT